MTGKLGPLLAGFLLLAVPALAAVPEPQGYRGPPYEAPVPATLAGALVIDDATAYALWWSGRVAFVDVMPRPERPPDLPAGTFWRDRPYDSIEGALWLPNTGYEGLAPAALDYFLSGLAVATDGDKAAPLVIFCRLDCWMSWNAAKRAVEHGYSRVYWYPDGLDGWLFEEWPVVRTEPYSP